MPTNLPLKNMTIEEKIQAMESIWEDLCDQADKIPSPSWHKKVLDERMENVKQGKVEFVDWETAKMNIKNDIS